MLFDNLNWHDGQLKRVNVSHGDKNIGKYTLEVEVSYYESDNSENRSSAVLKFENVQRLNLSCDFKELIDNLHAGNISNGYQKGDGVYRIYLVDGYLEIFAQEVQILS